MSSTRRARTVSAALGLVVLALSPVVAQPAVAATNTLVQPVPASPKGLLRVFLPGTDLSAEDSREFLAESVKLGYHTIGVNYPNSRSVGRICGTSDSCFGNVRREIVYGDTNTYDSHSVNSSEVTVAPEDSIVGQLTLQLRSLKSNPSWGSQFLTPTDGVNWLKVIIDGHSQGAGHAGILGIDHLVERVILEAGPNDDIGNDNPPSWTKATPATPEAKWFGLTHNQDKSKTKQLNSWNELFGFGSDTVTAPVPTGKHRLITTLSAPDDRYHESVAVDQYLNLDNGVPRLIPTWDSLLNGTLGSTSSAVATPSISPNGGSFTDTRQVTVTTTTPQATIRYTLDTSDPRTSGTAVTGPAGTSTVSFVLSESKTVKAYAFKSGSSDSGTATAAFTKGAVTATGAKFESVSTATGISASSITIDKPAGTAAGDFLLAAIRQKKTAATVIPPDAGWVLVRQDGNGARSALFRRTVTGSEPAGGYTFGLSTAANVEAHVLRFSGVDATTPVDGHGVGTSTSDPLDTVDAPGLTPTVAGTLYVAIWTAKPNGVNVEPPAGMTERSDTSVNVTLATATEPRGDTVATGIRTAGLTSSSESRIGQAVLLRSASGAVPSSVATPTISPDGGSSANPQTVMLTTATSGATIRYTTDGTEPSATSPLVYNGPFQVTPTATSPVTVKARAFLDTAQSGVASALFTFSSATGPTFEMAATATGAGFSSISVPRPTGTTAGNFLLAAVRQKKSTNTVVPPAGWISLGQEGASARSSLFYRFAGTEPGPYVFSLGTAVEGVEAQILRFSGIHATSPVIGSGLGTDSGSTLGTTVVAPSLEVPSGGGLYVAVWSAKPSEMGVTPPTGTVERTESSFNGTLSIATEARSAGPTGTRTATLVAPPVGGADRRIGQAVLLRPS